MNTFSNPQKIVNQLEITPGHHIADFGAGTGVYTLAAAEKIRGNTASRIFAIDIQKELLTKIAHEAQERHLESVHIIWGNIEDSKGTRLRHDSVDMVLMVNVLFQLDDRQESVNEAYRILKPDGKLVVIDWSESFGNIGPKPDHIILEKTARLLCQEAGFEFDHTIETGEHHYGFIVTKK